MNLHTPARSSNPTHPQPLLSSLAPTNTTWPRAEAPMEWEIPKQADFHIFAQGQSFFVWNLILKQGGLCGCLGLLSLPVEGRAMEHRRRSRSWSCVSTLKLWLSTRGASVGKRGRAAEHEEKCLHWKETWQNRRERENSHITIWWRLLFFFFFW